MPVDFLHLVMASLYVATWAVIGQVTTRRGRQSTSDSINRSP